MGRRHLANVRVVQRNVVYIVGMGPRFAKEEVRLLSSASFYEANFLDTAYTHLAIERVLWAIRQDIQDLGRQTYVQQQQWTHTRDWVVRHLPSKRRRCSVHCCRRWLPFSRWWYRHHACKLRHNKVLHGISSWRIVRGPQLHEPARMGGRK